MSRCILLDLVYAESGTGLAGQAPVAGFGKVWIYRVSGCLFDSYLGNYGSKRLISFILSIDLSKDKTPNESFSNAAAAR